MLFIIILRSDCFSRFINRFASVFFFALLFPRTNLQFTHCYFHVFACQRNGCKQRFSGCLRQNVGESGYAISSWSVSAGYLTSMLTEGAKVRVKRSLYLSKFTL